ncbi:MAG: hypothetical protein ACRDGW_03070 [Actinomycetota bacterium]
MFEWLPPDVELMTDVSEADWVSTRLQPWARDGVRIASYMPDVFQGYARVFHPAGDRGVPALGQRWADLAARNDVAFNADVAFLGVAGLETGEEHLLEEIAPLEGSLPLSTLESLVALLAAHGDEAESAWFCMWDGNGTWWKGAHGVMTADGRTDPRLERIDDERDRVLRSTPTVPGPSRAYFLLRGPLRSVIPLFDASGGQSPNLWWPGGRDWLVSTEVDGYSTYIGGARALIDDLVGSQLLETLETDISAHLDVGPYLPRRAR